MVLFFNCAVRVTHTTAPFFCLRKFTIWPGKNKCDRGEKMRSKTILSDSTGTVYRHHYYYFVCLCLSVCWTSVNIWCELYTLMHATLMQPNRNHIRYAITFCSSVVACIPQTLSFFRLLQNSAHSIIVSCGSMTYEKDARDLDTCFHIHK